MSRTTRTRSASAFRCGYLGLLHMEIVQERLEREFDLALVTTARAWNTAITNQRGESFTIDKPVKMPDPGLIGRSRTPSSRDIITPAEFVGTSCRRPGLPGHPQGHAVHRLHAHELHYDLPL